MKGNAVQSFESHTVRLMYRLLLQIVASLIFVGIGFSVFGENKDSVEYRHLQLNASGWQTNEWGWIIRVDRDRVFERLSLNYAISDEKWPSCKPNKFDEKNQKWVYDLKKDKNLYPLESAHVIALEIDGNKYYNDKNNGTLKTMALTGIKDLKRLIIKGSIPKFDEGPFESDWRKNLETVEFVDSVKSVDIKALPFLKKIKYIEFGANTVTDILEWGGDELSECYALQDLVVPYSLATNTSIKWGEIIRNTALKEREVLSFDRSEEGEIGNVVLLNMAMNGVISDCVTTIRGDAIRGIVGQRIYMPFNATNIIKESSIPPGMRLTLKKNGVLFYPDLIGDESRVEKSRSFKMFYPVSVATAYRGLVLTNSVVGSSSDLYQEGLSYRSSILLRRGERVDQKLNNSISAMLRLGTVDYPVWITPSKERIEIKFEAGVSGANKFKLVWSLIVFVAIYVLTIWVLPKFLRNKESFNAVRCIITAVGIGIGILIVFLGCEDAGVLQYYVDTYLTGKVMSYLNGSFISSLVISVSTTLLKLAVGFLQGIKVSVLFAGYDMNAVLQPVQDILEKISTYSWMSTCVLAFLRMVYQILKDCAGYIWPIVGVSTTLLISVTLPSHSKSH